MESYPFKPVFLKSEIEKKKIIRNFPKVNYIDAFERQIKELFIINNRQFIGLAKPLVYKTSEFDIFRRKKDKDYIYIFYPWNNSLVKCVKESDYFSLKTNRNKDLITSSEQETLYNLRVAVFGMSVGSNIAFVLTQSGVSKYMVIADYDELETTNLNRIWAGVHQIGLPKTVIAARRIYEDNPYAKVTNLTKGINKKILQKLLKEKKINFIVEEIDNLIMKIEVRKLAIRYKVPVLMITDNGDRDVLTIERYDLGYKKIFDKDINYWKKRVAGCKTPKDFGDIAINDVVGGLNKVDPRMLKSVDRVIKRELVSWPQLGSAALLGGIATTIAIKEIIRGRYRDLFTRIFINVLD